MCSVYTSQQAYNGAFDARAPLPPSAAPLQRRRVLQPSNATLLQPSGGSGATLRPRKSPLWKIGRSHHLPGRKAWRPTLTPDDDRHVFDEVAADVYREHAMDEYYLEPAPLRAAATSLESVSLTPAPSVDEEGSDVASESSDSDASWDLADLEAIGSDRASDSWDMAAERASDSWDMAASDASSACDEVSAGAWELVGSYADVAKSAAALPAPECIKPAPARPPRPARAAADAAPTTPNWRRPARSKEMDWVRRTRRTRQSAAARERRLEQKARQRLLTTL